MDKHDRLERIEENLAHLTRVSDDLSAIIARQEGEIARMQRRIGMLLEREAEREASAEGSIPLADQRPPHY